MRQRLDLGLLDEDDPFEIDDGNRPHLFAHGPYGMDDVLDLWASDPVFVPAASGGAADWLMVGDIPGEPPLIVPLAPPATGDPRRTRPIGIYRATGRLLAEYHRVSRDPNWEHYPDERDANV
jgi:hypothetical protein